METPFPPFDPDGQSGSETDTGKPTRLRDIPLRKIFPNLLTMAAICSGLTAIRFAIEDRMELAIGAIILAAFLDGIDGRVARFLKSTSRFGEQMDSLADFVNFGVAPAMLLYFSNLDQMRSLGWIIALVYAICACLRLARFNVMLDMPDPPMWQKRYFVGIPAPAAAMVVLLPIYVTLLGVVDVSQISVPTAIFTFAIGIMMVSTVPTFSGKDFSQKIRRDLVLPLMICAIFLVGLLLTYPWMTLTLLSVSYLGSIPFAVISWNKANKIHQAIADNGDVK